MPVGHRHFGLFTTQGPIALAFAELTGLASNRGVCMLYESTCLAGSPVVEAAKGLAAHPITAFDGIFNATTNFILGRMADGAFAIWVPHRCVRVRVCARPPLNLVTRAGSSRCDARLTRRWL